MGVRTIKADEDEEKTDNSRRKLHGREACEGSRPAPGEEADDGEGAAEDGIGSWRGRRAIFIGGRMHVYLSVLLLLTSIQTSYLGRSTWRGRRWSMSFTDLISLTFHAFLTILLTS